jgi:hypothetical protein
MTMRKTAAIGMRRAAFSIIGSLKNITNGKNDIMQLNII